MYLITYDLINPGQKYKELHELIKSYGTWCHPQESTWLVVTYQSSKEIYDKISKVCDGNDNVIIMRVTKDYYGSIPDGEQIWNWIEESI